MIGRVALGYASESRGGCKPGAKPKVKNIPESLTEIHTGE